jgi:hypothetical protein
MVKLIPASKSLLEGVRSVGAVKTGVVLREITPVPEKHRQMAALRANVES